MAQQQLGLLLNRAHVELSKLRLQVLNQEIGHTVGANALPILTLHTETFSQGANMWARITWRSRATDVIVRQIDAYIFADNFDVFIASINAESEFFEHTCCGGGASSDEEEDSDNQDNEISSTT